MSDPDSQAILRRKIGAQSANSETRGMSPPKAFRMAIARAAEDIGGLEATLSGCREEKVDIEQIVEGLDETRLILLLEGPERALGLAVFDPQVIGGVIEYLTTGRVVPESAGVRQPTRTDAMILSDFLDRTLIAMEQELAHAPDAPPIMGFRAVGVLEDDRAVTMALEEVPYRAFQLAVDLGRGAKSGEIRLHFPLERPTDGDRGTKEFEQWKAVWRKSVHQMRASVEAVLHRVAMPVHEISNLTVGSMIPVPLAMVGAVTLEGMTRNAVVTGKLGQCGGFRAVRINSDMGHDAVNPSMLVGTAVPLPSADLPALNVEVDALGSSGDLAQIAHQDAGELTPEVEPGTAHNDIEMSA